MKNRHWVSYTLDYAGIVALISAAFALGGTYWFSGTVVEAVILNAFTYCLMAAVGGLLAARVIEISSILRTEPEASVAEALPLPSANVEALPERNHLPRAA